MSEQKPLVIESAQELNNELQARKQKLAALREKTDFSFAIVDGCSRFPRQQGLCRPGGHCRDIHQHSGCGRSEARRI